MTDKIESMSKGVEKVSDRIHTIEFDNQNLLKSYFSLADRVSLKDSSRHAIQILFKNVMLSLKEKPQTLELLVQNQENELYHIPRLTL